VKEDRGLQAQQFQYPGVLSGMKTGSSPQKDTTAGTPQGLANAANLASAHLSPSAAKFRRETGGSNLALSPSWRVVAHSNSVSGGSAVQPSPGSSSLTQSAAGHIPRDVSLRNIRPSAVQGPLNIKPTGQVFAGEKVFADLVRHF